MVRAGKFIFRLSVIGFAAEVIIALSTFLPGAPLVPEATPFVLFPGIFIVHFRSVRLLNRLRKQSGLSRFGFSMRQLVDIVPAPRAITISFFVYFFAAWILGVLTIPSIGGQPTKVDGRYFLNNHGTYTPVSHAAYLHAVALAQRLFSIIPSVFYALAVIVNYPSRPPGGPDTS